MAFSATVRGVTPVGGPLRIVYGDWSGAAGDAAGSFSVGGRYVGSLWFKSDTTSVNPNTTQIFPTVQWDGNASPGTLTVNNLDNVTTGTFIIFTLGS